MECGTFTKSFQAPETDIIESGNDLTWKFLEAKYSMFVIFSKSDDRFIHPCYCRPPPKFSMAKGMVPEIKHVSRILSLAVFLLRK